MVNTNRRNRRPPHKTALLLRRRRLLIPTMHRRQPLQPLPERRTQPLIRLRLIREDRVPTRIRHIQRIQERRPRRLVLVRHITVPGNTVRPVIEKGLEALILRAAVHEVHFRKALGGAGGGVDVQASEVFDVVERGLNGEFGEVLVPEGDDFLLGDEEGEFVLAGVGKGGKLDAFDFGADGGGDVLDGGALGEEMGEGWVGVFAVFGVGEGFEGGVSGGEGEGVSSAKMDVAEWGDGRRMRGWEL